MNNVRRVLSRRLTKLTKVVETLDPRESDDCNQNQTCDKTLTSKNFVHRRRLELGRAELGTLRLTMRNGT